MDRDELLETNALQHIKSMTELEELIKDLVLEHKRVYEEFKIKSSNYKNSLFEEYKGIMADKGYKAENIDDRLTVHSPKHTIEFYERNEKVYLNFKVENSSVQIQNDGRVDFKNDKIEKLFILYITSNIEGKMFDFGGWSYFDNLTCKNSDHESSLEYYKIEYIKLKSILDEQVKTLNEIDKKTFTINLKLFVSEGALLFGGGHEKHIGKFSSLQEVIDKAYELL